MYTGPVDDGGYNLSQEALMNAVARMPNVSVKGIYNVPYTSQASNEIKLAIAQGYNVFVDTLGLGNLLTSVCKQNPQVACFSAADPTTQPPNSRSIWTQDWNFNYIAGVAAGLMTKSNVIGMVGSFKIPIVQMAANTYLLGCQSVDPKCKERVIFTNTYFDPSSAAQAANTLVDAGADVLRSWTDDPAFCEVAQKRGVYAVGEFYDFHKTCPKSEITSLVWDMSDYFKQQTHNIQTGTFHGSGSNPDLIPLGDHPGVPHLGTWGSFVPGAVKAKVLKVLATIMSGKPVITGPIRDQSGKLRFGPGVHPPVPFMFSKWTWYVQGLSTS
jgi:basic membrane protein A and related proteins